MNEKNFSGECHCEGKKQVKGVQCDVKNCAYHSGQSECFAGTICVGPCDADCSSNTLCATFKPKTY